MSQQQSDSKRFGRLRNAVNEKIQIDRLWSVIEWGGVIDEPRDLALIFGLGVGAVLAALIALSPAIGLYAIARHAGMATVPAAFVGVGGYTVALLWIRFGGVNVNINQ